MKALLITYLTVTAASFAYVSIMCCERNQRSAASMGLTVAAVGLLLIAWTAKGGL